MTKLLPPIENFSTSKSISQLFGMNAAYYSSKFPDMLAHNGIDIRCEYGQPILAAHDGWVQSTEADNPEKTKGNGIYLAATDWSFSTVYWHLKAFASIITGQFVKAGTIIGFGGNTGFVNPKPSPLCPACGTHLHFAVRLPTQLKNEYKGFIDPIPHLFNKGDRFNHRLNYDLWQFKGGNDVSYLQTILKIEMPEEVDFQPISYFGNKTRLAVQKLQMKYNLYPPFGYVGTKTRKLINDKYFQF